MGESQSKIVFFKGKSIRRVSQDGEWYFSVIDVVGALTDSVNPRDYWFKMKKRVHAEDGFELSTIQIAGSGREDAQYRLRFCERNFSHYSGNALSQGGTV